MSAWATALVTFGCVFGGAVAGMRLREVLPQHHLSDESRDIIKLVTGLIATLSALVLGLLIASGKNSLDAINEALMVSAGKVILIDRVLAEYGTDAADARATIRNAYAARIEQLFPENRNPGTAAVALEGPASVGSIERKVRALSPTTELQRSLQTRALALSYEIEQARWIAFEEVGTKTPPVFIAVLVSWVAAMFASFGLFAPRNRTALAALVIGALSVATAIFLIEEMNDPLGGIIRISSTPMLKALDVLGK
jgi:hypothetical protein